MPAAWLMLWIQRKLIARMQKRIGPPFYQPFFDFVKLMAGSLDHPEYIGQVGEVLNVRSDASGGPMALVEFTVDESDGDGKVHPVVQSPCNVPIDCLEVVKGKG